MDAEERVPVIQRDFRACGDCGQMFHMNKMFLSRDGRYPREYLCGDCYIAAPEKKQERLRREFLKDGLTQVVKDAAVRGRVPQIDEVLNLVIAKLDGLEGFVNAWIQSALHDATPGSRQQVQFFETVSKLLLVYNTHLRKEVDLSQYTEEELEEAMQGYLRKYPPVVELPVVEGIASGEATENIA